jgi:hypothetical protein
VEVGGRVPVAQVTPSPVVRDGSTRPVFDLTGSRMRMIFYLWLVLISNLN